MKPRLNRTIYIIYEGCIYKTSVYMINEKEFCHRETFDADIVEEYRRPLGYDEYDETWFTSLTKAKKALLKSVDKEEYPEAKILKIKDDSWVLAKDEGDIDYWETVGRKYDIENIFYED